MKKKLLPFLVCPIDQQPLEFVSLEDNKEINESIIENGILLNNRLNIIYPIYKYVPVMLTFRTHIHDTFKEIFFEKLKTLPDFHFPNLEPEKGEKFIQASFSEEWGLTDTSDDELTFMRTDDELVKLNKYVWLKWIDKHTVKLNSVLNVGCGAGKETQALNTLIKPENIIAIDLNFSVFKAARNYKDNPNMHFILCSLFHIPLKEKSFDMVYSQGVIHHTYSTRAAFNSICKYAGIDKYLFIWVYGLDDHLVYRNEQLDSMKMFIKSCLMRLQWHMEQILRPFISRAPSWLRNIIMKVMAFIMHPIVLSRVRHKKLWKLKNTEHSLRDVFTPVFAYTHTINEVVEWYEDADFEIIDFQSTKNNKKYFSGKKILGIGLTGKRFVS